MPDIHACIYCGRMAHEPDQPFGRPCLDASDGIHWTERMRREEAERVSRGYVKRLREAHRLLLAAAQVDQALKARARQKANLPLRPDGLDFETEAAKISDTIACHQGDISLSVGPTFEAIENG